MKTTQTREGRCAFDLRKLPPLYHLLAIVRLEGDERDVYLDPSSVYLLERHEVKKGYTFEELAQHELTEELVDRLFPPPAVAPGGSCRKLRLFADESPVQDLASAIRFRSRLGEDYIPHARLQDPRLSRDRADSEKTTLVCDPGLDLFVTAANPHPSFHGV